MIYVCFFNNRKLNLRRIKKNDPFFDAVKYKKNAPD